MEGDLYRLGLLILLIYTCSITCGSGKVATKPGKCDNSRPDHPGIEVMIMCDNQVMPLGYQCTHMRKDLWIRLCSYQLIW